MYNYETEKPKLLTDEGQKMVITVLKNIQELLKKSGAFMTFAPLKNVKYGDTWTALAIIDRLVELGEIREVTDKGVAGQDRVFVSA